MKILCVGRKGYDILKRQYDKQIVDLIELRSVKQIGYVNADEIAQRVMTMFANGEFDVATLFYSQFKSVIAQIPTAQRIIPAEIPASAAPSTATYDTSPTRHRSSPRCCRATFRCRSSGPA